MTRTIAVTLADNGTPVTDAVVTLANAGGTFGVRVAETDAVVVASGTPMPHVGGGEYAYAFTGAQPGVAYEATARIAWPDGSIDYVDRPLEAEAAGGEHYASADDLAAWQGAIGVDILSNAAGQKTRDAARVEAAIARADGEIDQALRARGYAAPLSPTNTAFSTLTHVACRLAGFYLFEPRLQRDPESDGPSADSMRAYSWRKQAHADLNHLLLFGLAAERLTDAPTWPAGVE